MRIALVALLLLLGSCGPCGTGSPDAGPPSGAGSIEIRSVGGGLDVRLNDLARPLRALQVSVTLAGALATSVGPAGEVPHDVIEAALDGPRSGFTLVVSDTRRLPLTNGAIAHIATDSAASSITLDDIRAIDADGERVTLEVETP